MTRNERIMALVAKGWKQTEIAKKVGLHPVTVWKITAAMRKAKPTKQTAHAELNGHSKTFEALKAKRDKHLTEAARIESAMNVLKEL